MKLTVTLRYQDKEYAYDEDWDDEPWLHGDGTIARTPFEVAEYLYTEGNYGCDCNRSQFLAVNCGVSFVEDENAECEDGEWTLKCGRTIELVRLNDVEYARDDVYGEIPLTEYRQRHPEYKQRQSGLYVPTEVK